MIDRGNDSVGKIVHVAGLQQIKVSRLSQVQFQGFYAHVGFERAGSISRGAGDRKTQKETIISPVLPSRTAMKSSLRPVYIAGVGISPLSDSSSDAAIHDLVISAGTKALLDAGLTYSDVKQTIACFLGEDPLRVRKNTFDTFGRTGAPICEVDCYSGLYAASQFVRSGHAECTMMVGFDKVFS